MASQTKQDRIQKLNTLNLHSEKYKLIYEWTKTGKLQFQEFLELTETYRNVENERLLLGFIEETRDLCNNLRFPTEKELRESTIKANSILETFKQQEQ